MTEICPVGPIPLSKVVRMINGQETSGLLLSASKLWHFLFRNDDKTVRMREKSRPAVNSMNESPTGTIAARVYSIFDSYIYFI